MWSGNFSMPPVAEEALLSLSLSLSSPVLDRLGECCEDRWSADAEEVSMEELDAVERGMTRILGVEIWRGQSQGLVSNGTQLPRLRW